MGKYLLSILLLFVVKLCISDVSYDRYIQKMDSVKILSIKASTKSLDSNIYYLLQLKELAENIKQSDYMEYAYDQLGAAYLNKQDFTTSKQYIAECLKLKHALNRDPVEIIGVMNTLAVLYKNLNERNKALEIYFEGLNMLDNMQNSDKVITFKYMFYNNISLIYSEQEKWSEAKNFLLKSYELNSISNNKKDLSIILNNLADLELRLGNLKSAENYLSEAEQQLPENDMRANITLHLTFAELYLEQKKIDSALQRALKAFNLSQNLNPLDRDYSIELIDQCLVLKGIHKNETETDLATEPTKIKTSKKKLSETTNCNTTARNIIDVLMLIVIGGLVFKLLQMRKF